MNAALYARSRETARKAAGVRTNPDHWASSVVHAFHQWTGEHTLTTWCGLDADLTAGARQTTDLITCLQCGEASHTSWWSR